MGKGSDMDVRRPLFITIAVLAASSMSACANNSRGTVESGVNKPSVACAALAIPDRFIVQWKDGSVSVEEAEDSEALVRDLIEPYRDEIEFAEHDFKVSLRTPADETVESMATPPAAQDWAQKDIGAYEAWSLSDGAGVTVAVIDSGADVTHPQLRGRIAINTDEIPNDGIDNDNNGLIDDYYGYDFHKYAMGGGSGRIEDPAGHGTHVSGIIAAEHSGPMKGVAPGAKLLPLNFMGVDGSGYIGDAIFAIDYAVRRGARIINASWGGSNCSLALRDKVDAIGRAGILFVAAAGNGDPYTGIGYNLDYRADYPAAFGLPWQLTVGATNVNGIMTGFSNFSQNLVHLMAPGWQIMSTYPMDNVCRGHSPARGYCYMSGTSMATPYVAGAAALLWSYRPMASLAQIHKALMVSVTPGDYPSITKGRLNIRKALDEIAKY